MRLPLRLPPSQEAEIEISCRNSGMCGFITAVSPSLLYLSFLTMDIFCSGADVEQRDGVSDDGFTDNTESITHHDNDILECDYDTQCTKLYKIIEEKQWEEVLYYPESGKFYDTTIFTTMLGNEPDPPSVQVRTWVTALDETGDVRWCQLPLHAAITFQAPFSVIARLVEIYPKCVRCADDQDLLPLHYAFRFGAEDEVVALLLERFPQAIGKKAVKDRLPLDMAHYSSKAERGVIIEYYVEHAVRSAKAEWDSEYEKMVTGMKSNADSTMKQELAEYKTKVQETERQLQYTQKELEAVRGGSQEGRDDDGFAGYKRLVRKKKPSRHNTVHETPRSSRAQHDHQPYADTQGEKGGKKKLKGLLGKLRKPLY